MEHETNRSCCASPARRLIFFIRRETGLCLVYEKDNFQKVKRKRRMVIGQTRYPKEPCIPLWLTRCSINEKLSHAQHSTSCNMSEYSKLPSAAGLGGLVNVSSGGRVIPTCQAPQITLTRSPQRRQRGDINSISVLPFTLLLSDCSTKDMITSETFLPWFLLTSNCFSRHPMLSALRNKARIIECALRWFLGSGVQAKFVIKLYRYCVARARIDIA